MSASAVAKDSRSHGVYYAGNGFRSKRKKYSKKSVEKLEKLSLSRDCKLLLPYLKQLNGMAKIAYKNAKQDLHWYTSWQDSASLATVPYSNQGIAVVSEGTTSAQRNGQWWTVKGFDICIKCMNTSATLPQAVRIIVFRYFYPNGGVITPANILETPDGTTNDYTICGYLNQQKDMFKVYYDGTHILQGTDSAFDTQKTVVIKKKCSFMMKSTSSTNNYTGMQENILCYFVLTDAPTDGIGFRTMAKVYFLP